jgi:hypothetical protein
MLRAMGRLLGHRGKEHPLRVRVVYGQWDRGRTLEGSTVMGTEGRCSVDLSANVGQKDFTAIDVDSLHLALLELAGVQDFFSDSVRHISNLQVGSEGGR